jgi:hypothetical protein
MCPHILNTDKGYRCQLCDHTIEGCASCQYVKDPGTKLKAYVGKWNDTHSGINGLHSDRKIDEFGSEYVVCNEPGPGLVVVPDSDGKDIMRRCEDAFIGCTKCENKGL